MQKERKRLIINYQNAGAELQDAIRKKYPLGWMNHTLKVKGSGDSFFYAITIDTEDASYLVKMPVKIDNKSDKDEDDFFDDIDTKEGGDNYAEEEDQESEKEE